MKQIILSIFFIILTAYAFAQKDSVQANKVQFKISINYNSGLNYYGRTDSLKSSGIFPMAELWFTSGLYLNAAPVFVHNKVQQADYAGTVTTLGYLHTSKKWLTNIYVLKPFYKQNSQLVQSALKAQTGGSLTFLNNFLNLNLGGDAKFSDKIDFGASAGLDHIIRLAAKGNSVVVLDPSVYVYAGTQQFSNTYLKKNNSLLFPETRQVTENVQQFNILSYEASVPVIFSKGKLQVLATPAYVLPRNLIKSANRPDLSETGKNMFYTTIGIKCTL
jgi:hypothetical protein